MADIRIIPAKIWMCGTLSRRLRHEHYEASMRVGEDVHRGLRKVFEGSYYTRAWSIDGELAAMAGALGSQLSPIAFVWVAMTDRATRYPVAIIKEGRAFLDELMREKVELVTTVIGGDEAALRFATFLGFHVSDYGEGSHAFGHHGRRRLMRYLRTEPDLRIPWGQGFAIRMGYHTLEMR